MHKLFAHVADLRWLLSLSLLDRKFLLGIPITCGDGFEVQEGQILKSARSEELLERYCTRQVDWSTQPQQ